MGGRARRGGYNRDSKKYYDWLNHAEDDLTAANLLKSHADCYNAAAFHCQQAIEKALKAYILFRSGQLVDGHNLMWLCRQAKKYDKGFHQWFDECADLNQCYIETRYPADILKELDAKEVANFYRMATEMFNFIDDEIDEELEGRAIAEEKAGKNIR